MIFASFVSSVLINHIVMRGHNRVRRSSIRLAVSEAWVIRPISPDTPLVVAGQTVTRFVRNVVVFWNSGPETIHKQDFPYEGPICFQMPGKMLDVPDTLYARGEGVRFIQGDSESVVAEFDVLRSGDGASAEIVHTGPDFRATLNKPWDGLEPRLRIWPILLIAVFTLGLVVDMIDPVLLLPFWGAVGLGVVLLVVVLRNLRRLVCLWGLAFDYPLGRQTAMDDTDLWVRRVPKHLRDTSSGKYTAIPSSRRS